MHASEGATALLYAVAAAPSHRLEGHVERPERTTEILSRLKVAGITDGSFEDQLHELPSPRAATLEEVKAVHSYAETLLERVEREAPCGVADIGDPDGATYVTETSFDDALAAAGTGIALVDAIVAASRAWEAADSAAATDDAAPRQASKEGPEAWLSAEDSAYEGAGTSSRRGGDGSGDKRPLTREVPLPPLTAGFAITRPPGHHATPDTPLGYCLVNNIALAAKHAQQAHGLKKVMILDFDLHHGNGTATIFVSDPSVLFIDTHDADSTYHGAPDTYHGTLASPFPSGSVDDIGEGPGRGTTINIPMPRDAGEACMLSVFDAIIDPAARRFAPEMILVSAGYDAHVKDPFQCLQLRSSTYHEMAMRLASLAAELCSGRLLFMLEGGYEVEAVGEAVAETWLALLGRPSAEGAVPFDLPRPEPLEATAALVAELRCIHGL